MLSRCLLSGFWGDVQLVKIKYSQIHSFVKKKEQTQQNRKPNAFGLSTTREVTRPSFPTLNSYKKRFCSPFLALSKTSKCLTLYWMQIASSHSVCFPVFNLTPKVSILVVDWPQWSKSELLVDLPWYSSVFVRSCISAQMGNTWKFFSQKACKQIYRFKGFECTQIEKSVWGSSSS